jgi:hypothetical protein
VTAGGPRFLDTCVVPFLVPDFEVNGRQHAVVRVLAPWNVEHLDRLEDVLPCCFVGQVRAAADAFALDGLEEAFRDHIAVAVFAPAHAGFQTVLAQEQLPLAAGELWSLAGIDDPGHDRSARGKESALEASAL